MAAAPPAAAAPCGGPRRLGVLRGHGLLLLLSLGVWLAGPAVHGFLFLPSRTPPRLGGLGPSRPSSPAAARSRPFAVASGARARASWCVEAEGKGGRGSEGSGGTKKRAGGAGADPPTGKRKRGASGQGQGQGQEQPPTCSELLWIATNQARVTADVAQLEKRVDKTDASIQGVKTELLMRADKTEASIEKLADKTEASIDKLDASIQMLADKTDASIQKLADKTDASIQAALKELKSDGKDVTMELQMRADKTDASIQMLADKTDASIQGLLKELKSDGRELKSEVKDVKGRLTRLEIVIAAATTVAGIFEYINSNAEGIGKLLGKLGGGG